ncbi:MAG: NAD(P)/FAD-dependent oxidoreductase [Chloroflexota bacterium]
MMSRIRSFRWREGLVGAAAGLLGGLVVAWSAQSQASMSAAGGLLGLSLNGGGLMIHLFVALLAGAIFVYLFRNQRGSYAATVSSGVLYGLFWWILGPLTLAPLFWRQGPTWSLDTAGAAMPSLIGHLFFGGIVGLCYYLMVASGKWQVAGGREQVVSGIEAAAVRQRPRIVILGGGFGGVSVAQYLERLSGHGRDLDVTVVSQSNYLLFTPMLAEVASSALQAQHISAPVRACLPYTRFLRGDAEAIDLPARIVQVQTGLTVESLDFDHLVLALGSVPHYHNLPGIAEHSFSLKTLEDASLLRNHVIRLLERADVETESIERQRQLTFVVAGGGFAGTELIAELYDLVYSVLHYYPRVSADELRFVLIHSRERILPELGPELADYALKKLQARGIEFILEARVAGATAEAVLLKDGRQVPTYTLVWTAGNQPHPLLQTLPCQRNKAGAVLTDSALRVLWAGEQRSRGAGEQVAGEIQNPKSKIQNNLWALGDCAQIPDPDHDGQFYPPTAQHALREGKTLAKNIVAALNGRPLKPFRFRTIGLLVALGHRTGAAELRGWRFSGLLAWFMWRTIYLSKLPGLEKKIRVALDWTLDLLFPRDIVLTRSDE